MIKEKYFIGLLGLLLPVLAFTACDDKKEDDKPRSIALTVDKDAIKSNGMDAATFTVNADGQPLASGYLITGEDGASLAGNTFTTTIPATYSFHAVYEGLQSQTATVRAEQVVLTHTADVTAINDDGESAVTFTVAADADLPGRASIFYRSGETETLLEGNVFRSEIEGDY
ncbi:MAG: hypothetical protein LBS80_00730, partial [Tannerella sp.]|nr:hypothetical protein [Tannerella sp.]